MDRNGVRQRRAPRSASRGSDANGAVGKSDDQSIDTSTPTDHVKSVTTAYILYFVGGLLGIHLLYLRRPVQAALWAVTAGGFGIGLLRDVFRIPDYVAQCNLTGEFLKIRQVYETYATRPSLVSSLLVGQFLFAWTLRSVATYAIPQYEGEFPLPVIPTTVAVGWITTVAVVHGLGQLGYRTGSLRRTAIWALLAELFFMYSSCADFEEDTEDPELNMDTSFQPGCNAGAGPSFFNAAVSVVAFAMTRQYVPVKELRAERQRQMSVWKRLAIYGVICGLFWGCVGSGIVFNGTIQDSKTGQTYRVRDALRDFFRSPEWQQLRAHVWSKMQFCWNDPNQCFNDMRSMIQTDESSARATLGVDKDASQREVRSAYRKLAREWHPDKCKLDDKAVCSQKFKEVTDAYKILKR